MVIQKIGLRKISVNFRRKLNPGPHMLFVDYSELVAKINRQKLKSYQASKFSIYKRGKNTRFKNPVKRIKNPNTHPDI